MPLDLVEHRLIADQRRRQLDHRVAAVVGGNCKPASEQLRPTGKLQQQPLESSSSRISLVALVPDQLDAIEKPLAADVADDRQAQRRKGGPERRCRSSRLR